MVPSRSKEYGRRSYDESFGGIRFIFSFYIFLISLLLPKIVWVEQECKCGWYQGARGVHMDDINRKEQLAKWYVSYVSPYS